MVVTDVGGNPEAVIDGESGLVVPPRNPARLADAILRVVGDEALRERLGAAARARVTAEFSFARCVERYDALYHALLAGRLPQDLPDIWAEAR
jgi:glycosyltransferase involved in cell wall biosynthesis